MRANLIIIIILALIVFSFSMSITGMAINTDQTQSAICTQGEITNNIPCTCGNDVYISGYCCFGRYQDDSCQKGMFSVTIGTEIFNNNIMQIVIVVCLILGFLALFVHFSGKNNEKEVYPVPVF